VRSITFRIERHDRSRSFQLHEIPLRPNSTTEFDARYSQLRSKQTLDRAISTKVPHFPRYPHWRSDRRAASRHRHKHGHASLEGTRELAGRRVSKTTEDFMSCGMSDAAWRIADA